MRPSRRALLTAALALAVAAGVAVSTPGPTSARGREPVGWVATWGASPVPPPRTGPLHAGVSNVTYRNLVRLSLGGAAVRLRLTNVFGNRPVRLDPVTVGLPAGGAALVPESLHVVTFGGRRGVTVPPGGGVFSDPVRLQVAGDSDLVVSLHVAGRSGALTRHPHAYDVVYAARGDRAAQPGAAGFRSGVVSWFFLEGVSVRAPKAATVVALGDSITDGARSTPGTDHRWPNLLARRLDARGAPVAVVDEGISGNQVLGQFGTGSGVPALGRLDRDVLAQPGVAEVIVLEGINDIRAGTQAPALLAGYRAIIARCHTRGLRVIGATLLPFRGDRAWTPARERTREQLNRWIRTSGAFDGVIDFDAVIRDPAHPDRMRPVYDSGDHLHPGDAGYAAMADAVNLRLLSRVL